MAPGVGDGQALPCARHSWFQPTPTDPLQGTAEPLRQAGSTSGKLFKKGQNAEQQRKE